MPCRYSALSSSAAPSSLSPQGQATRGAVPGATLLSAEILREASAQRAGWCAQVHAATKRSKLSQRSGVRRRRKSLRQPDAVRLLERRVDVLAVLLPVQVRVLDRRAEVHRHVHQRALGQVPLLAVDDAARGRLGHELSERLAQLGGVGAVGDGANQPAVLQLVGVLVVDVGEQQAGGVLLLLQQLLVDLLESPRADELEIDVLGDGELGELVLAHPLDARLARPQQDARLRAPPEVRPLRPEVDEQESHVDEDPQHHQPVDEQRPQDAAHRRGR